MDAAAANATKAVPGIPRDTDGPVFREPWEAQAFAMALALHARGLLASTQGEGRYTIRKRAGGANPTVLHLTVKAFDEGGEKL